MRVIYKTTPTTITDGQKKEDLQGDSKGYLIVSGVGSGGVATGGGITYTDKTLTSLTGSSQTMMASNASRKSLLIKNGDTAAGVNLLGGTAAIGGAGTITLQPYEGLFLKGADCPVGAITVIGTSTKYISGYEGA